MFRIIPLICSAGLLTLTACGQSPVRHHHLKPADSLLLSSYGIGLMLSKEFVRANQGQIWLESEPGKGSTFYFSFPVADNKAEFEEPNPVNP